MTRDLELLLNTFDCIIGGWWKEFVDAAAAGVENAENKFKFSRPGFSLKKYFSIATRDGKKSFSILRHPNFIEFLFSVSQFDRVVIIPKKKNAKDDLNNKFLHAKVSPKENTKKWLKGGKP